MVDERRPPTPLGERPVAHIDGQWQHAVAEAVDVTDVQTVQDVLRHHLLRPADDTTPMQEAEGGVGVFWWIAGRLRHGAVIRGSGIDQILILVALQERQGGPIIVRALAKHKAVVRTGQAGIPIQPTRRQTRAHVGTHVGVHDKTIGTIPVHGVRVAVQTYPMGYRTCEQRGRTDGVEEAGKEKEGAHHCFSMHAEKECIPPADGLTG